MSDDPNKAAAKLRKLGERARAGWAKLHRVSEKHLAAVRAAVLQQWEQEQASKPRSKLHKTAKHSRVADSQATRQARSTKTKQQSKSQDYGHSH
jgi:hypothetical protein